MSTILEMQIDELQEENDALKAINQKLQLEKNALKEQLLLNGVVKRTLERKIVALSENENWFLNEYYKGIDKYIIEEKEKEATELNAQIRVLRFIDSTISTD